jgi:hypothetical protein
MNARVEPIIKSNPNKLAEKLYRFVGMTADNELFAIQVKEDLKRGEKHFISVFPLGKDGA